jgi:2-polyprenyl-3-methyl-5-hydroxy-6-metoxy-1,4-benzoquinol methylase
MVVCRSKGDFMRIHHEDLSDVTRYIDHHRDVTVESHNAEFESIMWRIKRFVTVNGSTRILEVGTGTGWFPIMCKLRGLSCKGLEISPQLVEYGLEFGRQHGVEADIELGNIEDSDIGTAEYDVVIAYSVLEHVEHWQAALKKIADALRPGGVLFVLSTNKFALKSHEYNMPFYGWLPDRWRYRLRRMRQGEDIMKLGVDFNQFTHPQLRRCLEDVGFSRVMDVIELLDPENLRVPSPWKKAVIRTLQIFTPLKAIVLTFVPYTTFLCVK